MDTEPDSHHRRVPTLVQLCQRAAVAQVDSICSLGDITYSLLKPILERCTPVQLIRFEQLSPHLQKDTPEIWKDLCFSIHRLTAVDRYSIEDNPQEPDSWKSRFFVLQDAEAKRIEEVGSRLRSQRMEAVERKKEKEVKYTERIFDTKRPRPGWGAQVQPKSLFQKTKSEASRVQRAYSTRVLPPMPTAKNYRVLPQTPGATLPSVPSSSLTTRVVVNTVMHRRPYSTSSTYVASGSDVSDKNISMSTSTSPPPLPQSRESPQRPTSIIATPTASSTNGLAPHLVAELPRHTARLPTATKRDPMASLFVPKRKVPLQRPV